MRNSFYRRKVLQFLLEEDGPTAVEYAMMLAMIVVGAIGAVLGTGEVQKAMFEDVGTDLNSAIHGQTN